MILERIIFNVLAFSFFLVIFFKMIKKNDTNYTYVLIIQAVGIAISFLGLIIRIKFNFVLVALTYLLSIILPIAIIVFENNGLYLSEIIFYNLARYYNKRGNLEKSKTILQNAIEKFPNSYILHKQLADTYENNNQKQIAVDEYLRASEINVRDYNLKIKTINLLIEENKLIDAEKMANAILIEKPDCYEASILLGDILYNQDKFKEAINIYLQAINYNPNQYDLYYNLGIMYTAINDFQSAKECYEKAAELNSILYLVKYNLGQIALLYNEVDEAEKYFYECINDDSILEDAYYYLSYICMLKGEKESAIEYLNNAVENNEELYNKAIKETVFRTIIEKINKPSSDAKERKKISQKEQKNMKHLEETCAIVGELNPNDIKALRKIRKIEQEKEKKEIENKINDKTIGR